MRKQTGFVAALALVLTGLGGVAPSSAHASGDIGDHVHELNAHLDEYSAEVEQLTTQVDGLVDRYAKGEEVDTAKLIEWWEAVKVHAAIEVNHIPVYASIWQGLNGVQQGIDKGKPVAEVREQQRALESALWQGLGVVKLAAVNQKKNDKPAKSSARKDDTIKEILARLSRVAKLSDDGKHDKALELVHGTYANLFEGIEGELIEQDADLVVDLEKDFNVTLPQALEPDADQDRVETVIAAMKQKLRKADKLLKKAREHKKDVF